MRNTITAQELSQILEKLESRHDFYDKKYQQEEAGTRHEAFLDGKMTGLEIAIGMIKEVLNQD